MKKVFTAYDSALNADYFQFSFLGCHGTVAIACQMYLFCWQYSIFFFCHKFLFLCRLVCIGMAAMRLFTVLHGIRLSIVNLVKSGSLYNEGMRPLMYSDIDAKESKIGWRRCGENIAYFKNEDSSYVLVSLSLSFRFLFLLVKTFTWMTTT